MEIPGQPLPCSVAIYPAEPPFPHLLNGATEIAPTPQGVVRMNEIMQAQYPASPRCPVREGSLLVPPLWAPPHLCTSPGQSFSSLTLFAEVGTGLPLPFQ